MNFVQLCLKGIIDEETIDDYIDDWHRGYTVVQLYEYLGFTWEQYARYVMNPSSLGGILEDIKNNLED